MYSENLYLFFSLLGMHFVYCRRPNDGVDKRGYHFWIPSTIWLVLATFMFGAASLTRSTGVLMAPIFVGFYLGNRIIQDSNKFCSIFHHVFFGWVLASVTLLAPWVIMKWKPYQAHCDVKLDRTDQVPEWCLESSPNVYSYIQEVYWDNQLLGFLYRPFNHIVTSLPMNFIFFYIVFRVVREQTKTLFTVGICLTEKTDTQRKNSLFSMVEVIPHTYYMSV